MYKIDEILIDEDVLTSYFSCDLRKCEGACCTFPGEYGAPLKDEEIEEINNSVEAAKEYLSERSLKILGRDGFYEGEKGKLNTVCIDKKDCVFVFYDGQIALCALEKAYFEGKSKFRKPISCHLFPIRVGNYNSKYIYYERIEECDPAIEKGCRERIKLADSLKEALERAYGDEWTEKFITLSNNIKK